MQSTPSGKKLAASLGPRRYRDHHPTPIAMEAAMTTLFRASLLFLIVGMILGDIVLASVGLCGVCGIAIHTTVQQDAQAEPPAESDFMA